MTEPEAIHLPPSGAIPNNTRPLLLYRAAVRPDPAAIERTFAANGWSGGWRNGIYPFHHFHSNAHEVLGIAAGHARVIFGGPDGREVAVQAGDVVVIPAGVGHCRKHASDDLLVVGAYPTGADYDLCRPDPAQAERVRQRVATVPLPASDPVQGREGPLLRLWG
jgi:uncharacterized protein YjlB